jgi:hypothetical protein
MKHPVCGRTALTFALLVTPFFFPSSAWAQSAGPSLDFGHQTVGTTSNPLSVMGCCSNQSSDSHTWRIAITGPFVAGPNSTCPTGSFFIIGGGHSCTLNIVFRPQSSGSASGQVSLSDLISFSNPVNVWALSGIGDPSQPPPPLPPPTASRCDLNGDGELSVVDVQLDVNLAIGNPVPPLPAPPSGIKGDINGDGKVNVNDVQRVINAVLGLGCNVAPSKQGGSE